MEVTEELAMSALHMYAQGMSGEFIKEHFRFGQFTLLNISAYLKERFETETLAGAVGAAFRRGVWKPEGWGHPPEIPPRPLEALDWVSRGCSEGLVAEKMGVSVITANRHVAIAMSRLGAHKRTQAVWKSFHWGVLIP